MVYYGVLRDNEEDILTFLLDHFNALPRFNPRITEGEGDDAAVQLTLTEVLTPPPSDQLNYLHHPGTEDNIKAITHWIVLDLKTEVSFLQPSPNPMTLCWKPVQMDKIRQESYLHYIWTLFWERHSSFKYDSTFLYLWVMTSI